MISDTLHDAIQEIEDYQRNFPDCYGGLSDDIELVKKVMSALQARLDEPPHEYPLDIADTLDPDERERWRVTCEANVARWVERLRLLEPVSAEDLVGKLDDAIKRQEAMLDEWSNGPDGIRRDVFHKACEHWNEHATVLAGEALVNLLNDHPHLAEAFVGPISHFTDYWTEQIARAAFGLPNDDSRDLAGLRDRLDKQSKSTPTT
jgi:hypothetical protein